MARHGRNVPSGCGECPMQARDDGVEAVEFVPGPADDAEPPVSRIASSRTFSANTTSPGSWPGPQHRPYLTRPSNSPTVRCSGHAKSVRPMRPERRHLPLQDRSRHPESGDQHAAARLADALPLPGRRADRPTGLVVARASGSRRTASLEIAQGDDPGAQSGVDHRHGLLEGCPAGEVRERPGRCGEGDTVGNSDLVGSDSGAVTCRPLRRWPPPDERRPVT